MKKLFVFSVIGLLSVLPVVAADRQISGDYVEARTAAVFAGACFTNSEMNLAGGEAILAWKVRQGAWQGVDVSGLSVVAVVQANATLGHRDGREISARAHLVVDANATPAQRAALISLAHKMAGSLLDNVVAVEQRAIEMSESGHGSISVRAGSDIELATRPIADNDHLCRNADRYYEPLVELAHSMPAYTLAHVYSGKHFGQTWSSPFKASAYVGTFEQ